MCKAASILDLEIGQFLTEHGYFNSPPVAGSLELSSGDAEPGTLAILQGFVPNQGDAWKLRLTASGKFSCGLANITGK